MHFKCEVFYSYTIKRSIFHNTKEIKLLTGEHSGDHGVLKSQRLLQAQKVHIVGRVQGRWHAVDMVGNGNPSTQSTAILNIIDAKGATR